MSILEKFPPPSSEAVAEYDAAHKAKDAAEDRAMNARKGLELYWLKQERDVLKRDMPDMDGWEWALELHIGRSHLVLVNRDRCDALVVEHPGILDAKWRYGTTTERTRLVSARGLLFVSWTVDPAYWPKMSEADLLKNGISYTILTEAEWVELSARMDALPPLDLRCPS